MVIVDLRLDEEAFENAIKSLDDARTNLQALCKAIPASFGWMKVDWNSDAGRNYFEMLDNNLLKNLEIYEDVFEHMCENLKMALDEYSKVFDAADEVANAEF